ncbi:YaaR family protein [Shouchella shacheensis]|uniref:YaaR family protein n=1 Tax=Shouchella shacheensis TaxID=1649580 RepID=UPI0007404BEE|nr:YaaR family protein [Shouchella shacheensis]
MDVDRMRQSGNPVMVTKAKAIAPQASSTFREAMNHSLQLTKREEQKANLSALEEQGKRLASKRTAADLHAFKQMVKRCMDEAVTLGLKLDDKAGSFRDGRYKPYTLIQTVDKELLSLTENVFDEQKSELELLEQIGELKGMLVQLYL